MSVFYSEREPRLWWRLLLFVFITVLGIFVLHDLLVYIHSPKVGMLRGTTPGAMLTVQELVFVLPAIVAGVVLGELSIGS